MKRILLLLTGILWSASAWADQPVIYSKTVIAIVSATLATPAAPEPATAGDTKKEATPAAPTPVVHKLQVEVRPKQVPLNQGMYTNYLLDSGHGVMTYYAAPTERVLSAEHIYSKMDILLIRDDGVIEQIVPKVVLAYLTEEITIDFAVRAMLFLQAGLAEAWGLQPGDRIEHGMFTPRTVVIQAAPKP